MKTANQIRIFLTVGCGLWTVLLFGTGYVLSGQNIEVSKWGPYLLQRVDFLVPDLSIPYNGIMVSNRETLWQSHLHSSSSASYTTSRHARIEYRFIGKQIEWRGVRGNYGGSAAVFIDGSFVSLVNTYSVNPEYQALLFTSGELPEGIHDISIRLGNLNSTARAESLVLDFFKVWKGENVFVAENGDASIRYINAASDSYYTFIARKIAHVLMYFAYTATLIVLVDYLFIKPGWKRGIPLFVLFISLYDELRQSFVPGRTPSFFDIGVDMIGMVIAFLVYFSTKSIVRKVQSRKQSAHI